MKIVAKTDVGMVRESNQDSYTTGELPNGVAWAVSATVWAVLPEETWRHPQR